MRLAMVSFPVPVSPTISTLLSLSAITRTKSKTVRIRGLRPTTMESNENGWKSSTLSGSTATTMPSRVLRIFRPGGPQTPDFRQPLTEHRQAYPRRRVFVGKSDRSCAGHVPCDHGGHDEPRPRIIRSRRPDRALRPAGPAIHLVPDRRRVPSRVYGRGPSGPS